MQPNLSTPEVPIDRISVGDRFRKDLGDIGILTKSIESLGLLHPVVISKDLGLIAGFRRLEACKKLGWKMIPVHVVSLEDLKRGEFDENAIRKNFTASEMVAVKRYYEPEIKAEAKKRQEATHLAGKDEEGKPVTKADIGEGKFPPPKKGKTRDIIAKFAGVSGRTLEKAEDIVEAAEADPETFGDILKDVDLGKTSISHAHTKIKRRQKHIDPPPLPEDIFDVIYADPPWPYYLPLRGAPDAHYKTISIEDICNLKVEGVSIHEKIANDSILFLWATNPQLKVALEVVESWGFTYKTDMVWVKDRFGTGYYFRGQHELLLVATKGDIPPPVEEVRPSSVLHASVRQHSQKPEEIYDMIEALYPNRCYLELYARPTSRRKNWTYWGLETISPLQDDQNQKANYVDYGVVSMEEGDARAHERE